MLFLLISFRRDHPRSRGVYRGMAPGPTRAPGSSPLARGLRWCSLVVFFGGGIIPARAGFTQRSWGLLLGSWDHPRSRGVYAEAHVIGRTQKGSSPLARGLPLTEEGCDRGHGIIPARAGFTPPPGSPPSAPGDHPRSRGVYTSVMPRSMIAAGSSPLARGLRPPLKILRRHLRIIPARAGFTETTESPQDCRKDHPRSRGVYLYILFDVRDI